MISALIILLCIFLVGAIWWAKRGREFFKEKISALAPEVKVHTIYISDIDENNVTIVGDAEIINTLPADMLIDSLDYDLYIDSALVAHSGHTKKISIHRGDSARIKLPMELNVKKLRSIIKKFEHEKRDSAAYSVKGDFKMKIPVAGIRKFRINETKTLPALREIHVKAGKMNFDKMGLKNTELSMSVNVENHNSFPIQMKEGVYDLEIEHGIELHGSTQKTVNIPAKGSGTIDMDINTKTLKLPKLGWKWLFREHRTHYKMKFSCVVISDSEIMKNSKMKIRDEGTLDDLKQITKKLKN